MIYTPKNFRVANIENLCRNTLPFDAVSIGLIDSMKGQQFGLDGARLAKETEEQAKMAFDSAIKQAQRDSQRFMRFSNV